MEDYKDELNSGASDYSFVILESESSSPVVDGTENQNESFHKILTESSAESLKSMECAVSALNCNSSVFHENPNDIQQKLDQLVKDNLLLKETLNQSNITMKNQFSTLTLWYDEVMRTYESHKQKFIEGQEQILNLQMENANLKKEIEGKMKISNVTCKNCKSAELNLCSDEVDALKIECESFHEKIISARKNEGKFYLRNEELGKKLSNLMEEKLLLEKKYNDLLHENDKLKKEADILNGKCNKCQNPLDSNIRHKESSSKPQAVRVLSRFSVDEPDAEEKCLTGKFEKINKEVKEQQDISQQTSAEMKELKTECEELIKEKEGLQNALKACKTIMEQFREQIKSLNVQIKIKEETLENKTHELEVVKKGMEKLVLDCEEVALLRAQVEIYQNDFNEERMAREKAVGEKEKLAEEVRLLRRMIGKEDIKVDTKQAEPATATTKENPPNEEDTKDVCPLCSQRFPASQDLQTHFDACLDVYGFP